MTIKLSKLAKQDLDAIRDYTVETWGREQWLKYYRGLAHTLERIEADPDIGRDRYLFVEGMRSINFEKHTVFFKRLKAANNEPVILRIVHQRRHMPALVYYEDLDG